MGNHFFRLGTISISKTKNFIKFNKSEGICVPSSIHKKLKVDYWEYGDKCFSSKKKTFKVSDIFDSSNNLPNLIYLFYFDVFRPQKLK